MTEKEAKVIVRAAVKRGYTYKMISELVGGEVRIGKISLFLRTGRGISGARMKRLCEAIMVALKADGYLVPEVCMPNRARILVGVRDA